MRLATLIVGGLFFASAGAPASVRTVNDASLPGASRFTFHVQCMNARFGVIRVDRSPPFRVCRAVQDGSRPEVCQVLDSTTVDRAVQQAAQSICS